MGDPEASLCVASHHHAGSLRPLNLIWPQSLLDRVLEGYFIKEVLLAKIERPVRTILLQDAGAWPIVGDALFVSGGAGMELFLREARMRGLRNLGLFHIADEHGDQDRSFYGSADYVIRDYWFDHAVVRPSERSLGVLWVPNGYRTGVGPVCPETLLGIADRTIMGFFAGVLKDRTLTSERDEMVAVVNEAKLPFIVMGTPGFGRGLGPVSYAAYLESARFALIPGGNSPETIRLYDALECGAIPIMLNSPFVRAREALDNPPFVLLDSWRELPAIYARYAEAAAPAVIAELEAWRRSVVDWWAQFKARQQVRVRDLVNRSFERAYD